MLHVDEIKNKLMLQKPNTLNNKDAAVLLPLVLIDQELHVLFQVRALTLSAQPGETCFPGGRIDNGDDSPEEAALRELTEEFGIDGSLVSILAPLPTIETPRRGLIHPYAAYIKSLENIQPNKEEVDDWFTIPLSYLLDTPPAIGFMNITIEPGTGFPIEEIANRVAYDKRTYQTPEYFYKYGERIVWGLTSRILQSFIDQLKK
ncbi:NUDIX hydrolase [Shouchella patagoniensis]|uniref:NUDIX hydrolase n=1 Tax=Shouchella patagoniensis TaxID=228576 RepID=UPI000995D841|nr:CoA pyrophosphatase [Shouchella patagoniensis]